MRIRTEPGSIVWVVSVTWARSPGARHAASRTTDASEAGFNLGGWRIPVRFAARPFAVTTKKRPPRFSRR